MAADLEAVQADPAAAMQMMLARAEAAAVLADLALARALDYTARLRALLESEGALPGGTESAAQVSVGSGGAVDPPSDSGDGDGDPASPDQGVASAALQDRTRLGAPSDRHLEEWVTSPVAGHIQDSPLEEPQDLIEFSDEEVLIHLD